MKKLRDLYRRHREIVNYLLFGAATTAVSWIAYALGVGALGMGVNGGNVFSWVCAVAFAFVTNKLWVFDSRSWAWPAWLKEAAAFVGGRAFTGLLELVGLPLLIRLGLDQTLLGVEGFAAKVVTTIVVIILNYFLSKFIAFRKGHKK